jgi:exosome complex component RRP41
MDHLFSLTGLRSDGRKPNELRRVRCDVSIHNHHTTADGSASLEMGNTKVICDIRGPSEMISGGNQGSIIVTVVFTPFSTTERRKPSESLNKDRKAQELSLQLESALNTVVITSLFPRSQINCLIHVIHSDGGIAPACFNVTMLALMDAGIPITDFCTASSVGILDNTALLDPCHSEITNGGGTELWITSYPTGKVLTMSFTGRVNVDIMKELMSHAIKGAIELNQILGSFVRDFVEERS